MERLVIIGAGMGTGRFLDRLVAQRPGLRITLFNAEPRGSYNRLMLSPVLAGEKPEAGIVTHDAGWYAAAGIDCHFGEPVLCIDRDRRVVITALRETPYDRLVIATGAEPVRLPVPGADLPGVIAFRDLDDTRAMIAAARPGARAVVVGGGVLGLEAAAALRLRGMAVTVLHRGPWPMDRQLDAEAAGLLAAELAGRGIDLLCGTETAEVIGPDRCRALRLTDGRVLPADLVCTAIGIRPATRLARMAGLAVNRGVVVTAAMQSSDPAIFALGECAEHAGATVGLVAPVFAQAEVLAQVLCGETAAYRAEETALRLKVTGCDLFSAGDFSPGPDRDEVILRDPARGIYKRLVIRDDRLLGAVLYGDTADGPWLHRQIVARAPLGPDRHALLFGPGALAPAGTDDLCSLAAA